MTLAEELDPEIDSDPQLDPDLQKPGCGIGIRIPK